MRPGGWIPTVSRHVPADKSPGHPCVEPYLPRQITVSCTLHYPGQPTHSSNSCCESSLSATMAIELTPLPLPASADPSYFVDFGREVKGVNPGELTPAQFAEIHGALYKVGSPVISPWQLHVLNSFHPTAPPTSMVSSCSAMSLLRPNNNMRSPR